MGEAASTSQPSSAADWRELIQQAVSVLWPGLADGPLWIEAQVQQESGGNPRAVSPCGAQGLLQLMPATAVELDVANPFDPAENLRGGITYLRRQYDALIRVPDHSERLLWALASYNCGRGYVGYALALAETDKDLEHQWWVWRSSWRYLAHRSCHVLGRHCDYHQVVRYVERITKRAHALGARWQ